MIMKLKEAIEFVDDWGHSAEDIEARTLVADAARKWDAHGSWADTVAPIKATVADRDRKIEQLQRERDEARRERDEWAGQVADLRRERDEARRTCSLVQDDFTRVERDRDERIKTCVAQANVIAELNGTIERLQRDRDLRERGLIDCASSRQTTIEEQAQRIDQLDRMYDEVSDEATAKAKRVAELEGEIRLWDQSAKKQTAALQGRAARIAELEYEQEGFRRALADAAVREQQPPAGWRKTRDEMVADFLSETTFQSLAASWLLRWEPKS